MTRSGVQLAKPLALPFLFLILLCARLGITVPVGNDSDFVSVEEQNSAEQIQTPNVEDKDYNGQKPIYEFQVAVWPEDDFDENVNPIIGNPPGAPIFEEQEVVYPDLTEQDSSSTIAVPTWQNSQTTTWTTKRPELAQDTMVTIPTWQRPQTTATTTKRPLKPILPGSDILSAIYPGIHFQGSDIVADQSHVDHHYGVPTSRPHVEVIEQYQVHHPNGTTEYKLVLSNGMTNYKKIYAKTLSSGKVITVQEGYDSVPIPGDDLYSNEYQTQFYIADENGHNVYRVEKHTRRPKLPDYLDYKLQLGQFQ